MLGFPALRWHPFFCARRVLVGADDRAVQQQPFQIGILQLAENAFPNSFGRPAIKTFPDRVPLAKSLRKIAPRRSGLADPKDRVHEESIVLGSHSRVAFLARQKILDSFPVFIRNRVATKHYRPSLAWEKEGRSLPTTPSYCPHGLVIRHWQIVICNNANARLAAARRAARRNRCRIEIFTHS